MQLYLHLVLNVLNQDFQYMLDIDLKISFDMLRKLCG